MNFKIGDKVRFLNEPGGGIITKIISTSMVNVAIEEGFEIPTMTSELLLSTNSEDKASIFHEEINVNHEITTAEPNTSSEFESLSSSLKRMRVKSNQDEGVFIALIPHDQKWLVTGLVDLYIINSTEYDILYNFYLNNEGKINGIDYGSVEAESKILIETISRDDIDLWRKGYIQLMFHSDKSESLYLPVNADYTIRATQMVRDTAYINTAFLEEKSFLVKLILKTEMQAYKSAEAEKKYDQQNIIEKKAEQKKPLPLISKHRTDKREAVVDLHIGELVDNISGLSSKDMLDLQIRYFEKCLNSAIESRYRKVTFIHGVGNGTLKYSITEKIKDYSGLENYDASLAKFGVGAIDIIIRYN